MNDLISRQAAIDALGERPMPWTDDDYYVLGGRNQYDSDRLAIETVPSAQQWIPCSERLPKESQNVLTIDRYGDYEINHIIDGDEWYWEPSPVAWCPLPEPYKEEQP